MLEGNPQVLLDKARSLLGKDASPQNLVDKEYACAESVTSILHSLWPPIPIITGTYTLHQYLIASPLFFEVKVPLAGDLIISPTGEGTGVGHTGIMDTDAIMSNNSYTGLWDKHLDLNLWKKNYGGRLPIIYYRKT